MTFFYSNPSRLICSSYLLHPQLVFDPAIKNRSAAIFDSKLHAPPFVVEDVLHHLLFAAIVQQAHFLVPTRPR